MFVLIYFVSFVLFLFSPICMSHSSGSMKFQIADMRVIDGAPPHITFYKCRCIGNIDRVPTYRHKRTAETPSCYMVQYWQPLWQHFASGIWETKFSWEGACASRREGFHFKFKTAGRQGKDVCDFNCDVESCPTCGGYELKCTKSSAKCPIKYKYDSEIYVL